MIKEKRRLELKSIVEKLRISLPVVKKIDDEKLRQFFNSQQYREMVSFMKNHMRIDCRILLKCMDGQNNVTQNGDHVRSTPAFVTLPEQFPLYGSTAYKNLQIKLTYYKAYAERFHYFSMMIAHELSHIVLYSINHELKHNEEATDITAIMLGFETYFELGHTTLTKSANSKLGYLKYEEMIYVMSVVDYTEEDFLQSQGTKIESLFRSIGKIFS